MKKKNGNYSYNIISTWYSASFQHIECQKQLNDDDYQILGPMLLLPLPLPYITVFNDVNTITCVVLVYVHSE